jgi:hypothetical protein
MDRRIWISWTLAFIRTRRATPKRPNPEDVFNDVVSVSERAMPNLAQQRVILRERRAEP